MDGCARIPINREFAVEGEEVGGPVHGLDGAEAEAREDGFAQDRGDEVFETLHGLEVASPAAEVDSRQDQLFSTLIDEAADIVEAGGERDGARGPAGGGDDAEGAAIAASILHFEVGAGLVGVGGEGERGQLGVGEGVVVEDFRSE